MKWSWKIGEYAGIGVYVHATFVLLIGWVAWAHWAQSGSLAAVFDGVAFMLAIFACVVLHEFGHALTARRYGIRTRDITLLPIGGIARLERMPDKPIQELWVALAGPAVNVVIAVLLYLWLGVTGSLRPLAELSAVHGLFAERLLWVNVLLVGFNLLLPAFPMDGGRVLRALLATWIDYTRATQIAAFLGQGMALVFGFLGLTGNPFLLFIALFVWIGAAQEASLAQMKAAFAGIPVSRAMVTDFETLSPDQTLGHAVERILAGSQHDFPVVESGRVVGILTRHDLLRTLASEGAGARVDQTMRRDFQTVDAAEMLESAFQRLQGCECHTLPVTRGAQLAGLLTMDNVGEFVLIQSALTPSRSSA
jgi:Zn-dependent protease